ncbi:hypothetical protein RFI_21714 [Reticulomyxa filosa]|uniref:Uncharacterized protein n=1 Tax=Reticulomyxa filosa TaxID=46433 RepID=X6MRB5_RETFI|nr:hypothetical protein RFI_21714 [Reticulomyxa filosa]|eukprot:ETO15650.1 hypothetical protein RFI_21714 [Reticulomyxa filosa]
MKNDAAIRTQVVVYLFRNESKYTQYNFKDGRYSVTLNITEESSVRNADVRDWSVSGVMYYQLPVFFEGNSNVIALENNWKINVNERHNVHVMWIDKSNSARTNGFVFVGKMNACGGMQVNKTNNGTNDRQSIGDNRHAKEVELLMVFFSNITNEFELQSKLEEFNGNVSSVIEYLASKRHLNQVKSNTNSNFTFCFLSIKKKKTSANNGMHLIFVNTRNKKQASKQGNLRKCKKT